MINLSVKGFKTLSEDQLGQTSQTFTFQQGQVTGQKVGHHSVQGFLPCIGVEQPAGYLRVPAPSEDDPQASGQHVVRGLGVVSDRRARGASSLRQLQDLFDGPSCLLLRDGLGARGRC